MRIFAYFWMPPSGFAILHNKTHSRLINIPIIMLILTFALEVVLLPQECTKTINLITFPSLLNIILYYLMAVGNNNALMTLHSIYFFFSIAIYASSSIYMLMQLLLLCCCYVLTLSKWGISHSMIARGNCLHFTLLSCSMRLYDIRMWEWVLWGYLQACT